MKNTDIKKLYFANNGVVALYKGNDLIWRKKKNNIFAGRFSDDTPEEITSFEWYPNQITEPIIIPIDPITKEFSYEYDGELTILSNNVIYNHLKGNGKRYLKEITSFPSTSKITSLVSAFKDFSKLDSIDFLSTWDLSNVSDMSSMFTYCPITRANLSNLNLSNVSNMSSMFTYCPITRANLSNLNLSNVSNMSSMFTYCPDLTSVQFYNSDLSNLKNMYHMFYDCQKLTTVNFRNCGTIKPTNINWLFRNCTKLTTIYLPTLDLSDVAISDSFYACYDLKTITGVMRGIKYSFSLRFSPLTNASAMVFINGLNDVEETKTITFKASTYKTLTEQQIAIATSKGWSVVSA